MHRIRLRTAGLLLAVPLALTGCAGGEDEAPMAPGTVDGGELEEEQEEEQEEDD